MNNSGNIAKRVISKGIERKCVKLIISSYAEIRLNDKLKHQKPIEEIRRNQIVLMMIDLKQQHKFKYDITLESGTIDKETFKTLGRIDICISHTKNYDQRTISFECKRFVKANCTCSAIEEAYYENGIMRYEVKKYPTHKGFAGMVSFFEEGDYIEFNRIIIDIIKSHSKAGSFCELSQYAHDYVYESKTSDIDGAEITLNHILFDFT
jgi:hypothetical protein